GDEPVATWQDARWTLLKSAVQKGIVKLEVRDRRGERAVRQLDLSVLTPADLDGDFLRTLGLARFQPEIPPEIGRVAAGGSAERAGLNAGDEILSINGGEVRNIDHAIRLIRESPGKTLIVVVRRSGARLPAVALVPDAYQEKGGAIVGRINAVLQVKPE